MAKLYQYCTLASRYDGAFGGPAGWPAAGMGYVIVTEGGQLIVIDGGHAEDAAGLHRFLRELSGQDTPTVSLWLLTHPHGDHIGALMAMPNTYPMHVERVVYDFPADYSASSAQAAAQMQQLCTAMGATVTKPKPDQHICIDGIDLHLLYTPAMGALPGHKNANVNFLSLILQIKGSRKTAMITGDAYFPSLQVVLERYGAALRSDILQFPHHGLCDSGHPGFYRTVAADTVLIPISVAGYRAMHDGTYEDCQGAVWNAEAEQGATLVYKAFTGTVEFEI